MSDYQLLRDAAAAAYDADIVAYFGNISRDRATQIIDVCRKRRLRRNCVLWIYSYGGDAHAAYRIARHLQEAYRTEDDDQALRGTLYAFVSGVCKSAGTILTLGASKLILGEKAELGPIDAQIRNPEEVGERTSGLTPIQALGVLEQQSVILFRRHFRELRFHTDLSFSTRMSADIATQLTKGLLTPLYEQLDPIRLAEIERSLRISQEYGTRIEKNLKPKALEKLISGYPTHSFVIDRKEAKDLFKNVESPKPELATLTETVAEFADFWLDGSAEAYAGYLTDVPPAAPVQGVIPMPEQQGAAEPAAAGGGAQ
jgi:hypothetical protein